MGSNRALVAGKKVAIFDVCDTLYDANTTAGFIEFVGRRADDSQILRIWRRWTSRTSPAFYVGAVAARLFSVDVARKRLIGSLRGFHRQELQRLARDYAAGPLVERENRRLHERLAEHRRAGERIILLSSSLDVVVEAIAAKLGAQFEASRLQFVDDVCTGKLKLDLTGRKRAHALRLCGPNTEFHVYTDNRSDLDLLALATGMTIVLPRGRRRRWARLDCEYIEL